MVVDDDRDIVLVVKAGLEQNGYLVDTFTSSREAMSRFKPGFYDLVLLDYLMPRMSGSELYQQIKEADPQVKFIVLSLYEIDNVNAFKEFPGINPSSIMRKPSYMRQIIDKVNQLLV